MKRYLLFAGSHYYPGGGVEDYEGSFDTPEEAKAFITLKNGKLRNQADWYQIVDKETMQIVEQEG